MAKEIYATHGIFFFEKNEDVKVFDALTDEEILEHTLDPYVDTIELPTIIPVDLSDYDNLIRESMGVEFAENYAKTTYLGSSAIGLSFWYGPFDLTNVQKIKYDLTLGNCYGGGSQATQNKFGYKIGVCTYTPGNSYISNMTPDYGYDVYNIYLNSNTSYLNQELDVSEITGQVYIGIDAPGWTSELSDLVLVPD